jgi:glutamyl-tRNA synthetase
VRFSPSPTGPFHVGGARTALFNWLFARGRQGEFLVRNEDTDPVRSSEHWLEGIFDGLRWLGLDWDGEIVNQSDRKPAHLAAAQQLVDSGHAYWCDCTAEEIERRKGPGGGYDGFCRDRGLAPGEDRVVRFRVPQGSTTVDDVVRGSTTFDNATIDDFVIVRRGGAPIFVLANAVDDEYQQITHVIRGEEHLPTTPRYLMLRRALGYGEDPVFAHLPVLVNEKRQKLSKRRDKVALLEFRDQGYIADAMRSYLALLGWSPRDGDEFAPLERLVAEFRLEDVTRAPAFFDVQKLQHINAHYLREMTPEAFAEAARPWVEGDAAPWPEQSFDAERFVALAPLVQTRVKLLSEVPELVAFVFQDAVEIDEAAWEKAIERNAWSADVLRDAAVDYADVPWEAEALKDATAAIAERHGVALRKAQAPVRVAVTGTTVGLPLFESLELLGREPVQARLEHALERVGAAPAR